MKDYKDMTPIELNNLVTKVKENHEFIKKRINDKLTDVEKLEVEINKDLNLLDGLEKKYVELMGVLMEKQ
jgi:hypothetical protein